MAERRTRLKNSTAEAHARLDAHVDRAGFFASQRGYRDYLRATWRARAALETLLDRSGTDAVYPIWPQRRLRALLLEDLRDVGETASDLECATPEQLPLDRAGVLGTLYVLEGSALGARLIGRRVAEIGMTAQFGARHLDRQTGDNAWSRFLTVLEATPLPAAAEQTCVSSALATFAQFEREYGVV